MPDVLAFDLLTLAGDTFSANLQIPGQGATAVPMRVVLPSRRRCWVPDQPQGYSLRPRRRRAEDGVVLCRKCRPARALWAFPGDPQPE